MSNAPAPEMQAQYHCEQAMAAAKKMRSTKQKRKTGQMVCHHLRMMLNAEPAANDCPVMPMPAIQQARQIEINRVDPDKVGEPANDSSQFQLGF